MFLSTAAPGVLVAVIVLIVLYYRTTRRESYDTPPTVRYFLPWFGSAFQYAKNPTAFLKLCNETYGGVYKLLLAGRVVVILATPATMASVYKDAAKVLKNDLVQFRILTAIAGATNHLEYLHEIVAGKLSPVLEEQMRKQLLVEISGVFYRELNSRLEDVSTGMFVKLSDFTARHVYHATSAALFGPLFPDTYADFHLLDIGIPQLVSGIPFTGRGAAKARERLRATLVSYVRQGGDSLGAAALISKSVQELQAAGLSESDAAGLLLIFLWGLHGNTLAATFWLFAHLLADRDAMDRISQEIRSTASPGYSRLSAMCAADPNILFGPLLPLLDSAVKETLRLHVLPTAVRTASEATMITGEGRTYHVAKGEYVMADVRAIYQDPDTFEDPTSFRVDRFLDEAAPRLISVWGSGSHICKGRYFAQFEMKMLIMRCLELYDIHSLPGKDLTKSFPGIKPRSIGMDRPDGDILIRLVQRS
ncbi:cytochrome P450 [Mycena alexandri]|uniref:Cytochrome P450 n=1 Tax=Mycena alexandri TaxID=1745969 RepID=A0AAD6T789_9AGAR|nr:cytochrome P450 [Mycena alexandri]